MKRETFYRLIIVCLVVINLAMALWMFMHRPSGGMYGKGGPARYIIHELQMSPEQEKNYMALVHDHRAQMEQHRGKMEKLRERLFSMLGGGGASQPLATALSDSIAAEQKQVEMITFDHFAKTRAICNPGQQQKFDAMIQEVIKSMAGPPKK